VPRRVWAVVVVALVALATVASIGHGRTRQATVREGAHRPVESASGLDDVTTFAVLPPDEIARQATREMKALRAVHYRGSIVVHGDRLALVGAVDDKRHCHVSVGAPGGAMQVRRTPEAYFVRFDRGMLLTHPELLAGVRHVSAALIDVMSGKWWEIPGEGIPELGPMCALHARGSFIGTMVKALDFTTVRGDVARVAGQLAVQLVPPQGEGQLWIAATGKHRIVRISDGPEGDDVDSVDVVLTGFDRPVKVTVPPHRLLPGYSVV